MYKRIVGFSFVLVFVFAISGISRAENFGVMLEPLRVEFKDGRNSAQVTVINQSQTEPVSYRIETAPMRMAEDGSLFKPEKMTKREGIAKAMTHFSPRISTLPPGKKQTIRVAVRRPPGLPDGEYFTYMTVTPLPRKKKDSGKAEQDNGVSISINMNVAVSIPIIVSKGVAKPVTRLISVQKALTEKGEKALRLKLGREGNYSSYVGVSIYGMVDGQEKLIALRPRVVTFVPLKERLVTVPLKEQGFKGGTVRVQLHDFYDKDKAVIGSYELKI